MRGVILAVVAVACSHPAAPAAPLARPALPAARWVPDSPSYVVAGPTLGHGLRSLRSALDLLGPATIGLEVVEASRVIERAVGVDVLNEDPLTAIGVDTSSSWAVFSDDVNPTFVVHLAAKDQMTAFLERQREHGLVTQAVIAEGVEVISARVAGDVQLSWAIADSWMWLHVVAPGGQDDGVRWFTSSRASHRGDWAEAWGWAQRATNGGPAVVGLVDLHGPLGKRLAQASGVDLTSARRIAFGFGGGDDRHFALRLVADIGSTDALRAKLLPPPPGWDAAATGAALAVQCNLDLSLVAAPLTLLWPALGRGAFPTDELGVRAGRAFLLTFDPSNKTGTGALALDLTSSAFFERQFDRIPLRRALERKRIFGTHNGATISVPFSVTLDYVLEPKLLLAAIGNGVLDKVVAPGAASELKLLSLDVVPPALSVESWQTLIQLVLDRDPTGAPGPRVQRTVERLMRWRELHGALSATSSELVLSLAGERR